MFNIGRVCVKLAGRDAGQKCVIVEILDEKTVLIDGMTRRRKCNKLHFFLSRDKLAPPPSCLLRLLVGGWLLFYFSWGLFLACLVGVNNFVWH